MPCAPVRFYPHQYAAKGQTPSGNFYAFELQRSILSLRSLSIAYVAPYCSGYHYCTTSFNQAWNQVLHRFNHARGLLEIYHGEDLLQWSRQKHSTKTIHHYHYQ